MKATGLALAVLMASTAQAAPRWDPRAHREIAGAPTQVLVLGSPHLSALPPAFKAEHLKPMLDRLAAWKPTMIAVEDVSGEQCDQLRRFAPEHDGAADTYCWDPAPAAKAAGLSVPEATAQVRLRLATWPKSPTASQRRHLAALFLASGDRASALVQWLRLPDAERSAGDGLDASLVELLEKARQRNNESYQVASVLAARLGLERIYPVDDHTADGPPSGNDASRDATMTAVWKASAGARMEAIKLLEAKLGTSDAALALYRTYNDPANAQVVFDSDFGAMLKEPSAQQWGRRYVAWWEARNLRMVANIVAAASQHPGARVLAVVGASHKPYYEAYLDMLHDINVADTSTVLK